MKHDIEIADHSLATQDVLSDAPNYNEWIFQLIHPFLGQRILDLGCATGNITQHFLDRQCIVGIDRDPRVVEQVLDRFAGYPNFRAYCVDFSKSEDLYSLVEPGFDTITCLNVLEHIEDDVSALATMRKLLAPGGRLILLVPALKWLYGSMDRADGHHRRYSFAELKEKLTKASFTINKMHYMNAPGVLGWFLNAHIRKVHLIPRKQLVFYDKVIPLVRAVEAVVTLPIGQSLIAITEKSDMGSG